MDENSHKDKNQRYKNVHKTFSWGQFSGGNFPGGSFPGGIFPRIVKRKAKEKQGKVGK